MIQMGDDGKVRWSKLHYSMGDIGNSMHEGTVFACQYATASCS